MFNTQPPLALSLELHQRKDDWYCFVTDENYLLELVVIGAGQLVWNRGRRNASAERCQDDTLPNVAFSCPFGICRQFRLYISQLLGLLVWKSRPGASLEHMTLGTSS